MSLNVIYSHGSYMTRANRDSHHKSLKTYPVVHTILPWSHAIEPSRVRWNANLNSWVGEYRQGSDETWFWSHQRSALSWIWMDSEKCKNWYSIGPVYLCLHRWCRYVNTCRYLCSRYMEVERLGWVSMRQGPTVLTSIELYSTLGCPRTNQANYMSTCALHLRKTKANYDS